MVAGEAAVWGVHAGKTGDAEALFLQQPGCIALGWPKLGDLSVLAPKREAFKAAYIKVFPGEKAGNVTISAGQLFRFLHELKDGDLVVYRSKSNRMINIGRIIGPYTFVSGGGGGYPHRRTVEWLKKGLSPSRFTQGALFEVSSAMSLFRVRNYAEEFIAASTGEPPVAPPVTHDETVTLVAEQIEQTTRDFILKRLAQELKGHPLASFIAHLLGCMGYRTRVAAPGPDGGVDVVAHRDELGFEPPIIKVQVKSSEGPVGQPAVSALYGNVAHGEYGLLVTLGTFTLQARNWATGKSNLRLIDGDGLIDLILIHYEQFDSRYKGLLPLTRVYVPESVDEGDE